MALLPPGPAVYLKPAQPELREQDREAVEPYDEFRERETGGRLGIVEQPDISQDGKHQKYEIGVPDDFRPQGGRCLGRNWTLAMRRSLARAPQWVGNIGVSLHRFGQAAMDYRTIGNDQSDASL